MSPSYLTKLLRTPFSRFSTFRFLSLVTFALVLSLFPQNVYSVDVTLAWDPNTEPDLAGYWVYYGTSSGIYPLSIDVDNLTTYTVSDLEEGQTYYFAVTAYDFSGNESDFSNEVSIYLSESEAPPFEIGEVRVDHNWARIEFCESFFDPVVVAKPLSLNGSQPAVVRIRNVDESGFEIRVQEWEYLDGWHYPETVSYLVMEHGSYTLNDGTRIEAGTFETNKASSYENVTFEQPFQTVPVVMAAISSFNGGDTVTGRMRNITIQGFEFCMQEQELNSQSHTAETISYIAWEPSSGNIDGITFAINKTGNVVTQDFQNVTFTQTFMTSPMFLADIQTTNGGDTANVRWQNKDAYGVEIHIDEEQSMDTEIDHKPEIVGYMVFSQ